MTKDLVCRQCSAGFTYSRSGSGRWPLYCSDECRRGFERERQVARSRAGALRLPPAQIVQQCEVCGGDFVSRRGTAKYCSPPCLLVKRAGRAVDLFTCVACHQTWERKPTKGRVPRLCPNCRASKRNDPSRLARMCKNCGQGGARTDYCSRACVAESKRTKWPTCPVPRSHPSRIPWPERGPSTRVFITDCGVCSATFVSPYTTSTCSDACRAAKYRAEKNDHRHRRRAREHGAFVAPVNRRHVIERDRGRCHLCGARVRLGLKAPHPLAPTLDHVIPLAAGGTHEPANVRLAHFLCNSRKGDRGGNEQLLLIG